jgi:hypothetical protein
MEPNFDSLWDFLIGNVAVDTAFPANPSTLELTKTLSPLTDRLLIITITPNISLHSISTMAIAATLAALQVTQANAIAALGEGHDVAIEEALEAVELDTKIRSNQRRSIANRKFHTRVQAKVAKIIAESSVMLQAVQQLVGHHIKNQDTLGPCTMDDVVRICHTVYANKRQFCRLANPVKNGILKRFLETVARLYKLSDAQKEAVCAN